MSVKERVEVLLASLGGTADEVADSLRARGIKGKPEDPCECPIANLIRAEIPAAANGEWTYNHHEEDGWFVCRTFIRAPGEDITPPSAVAEFIEHFDGYPVEVRYDDLRAEQ